MVTELTVLLKAQIKNPGFFSGTEKYKYPTSTVLDERYNLLLEYIIESPALEVFLEPLSKENIVLSTPEKIKSNKADSKAMDTHGKDRGEKIFIPKISAAIIKQSKPFIFDLASGKLIFIFVTAGDLSAHTHDSLMNLGKGDIKWDGSLITVRNAKALTISQELYRPLKSTPGKWQDSYSLPNKSDLPYSLLIVNNEGDNYLLTIHTIKHDGIWITYKKLNSNEVRHYLHEKVLVTSEIEG